jgi:hypothetical protein
MSRVRELIERVARRPTRAALFVLAVLAAFTTFRMPRIGGWDDAFYLAQLTSVVGDGDLMLQDDLLAVPNPLPTRLMTVVVTLESGAPANTFSIGPAIVHSAYLWPVLRRDPDLTGTFRILVALGSMALLAVTVLATARWLGGLGYSGWTVPLAASLPVLWSPLALYGTRAYLNSHLPATAAMALLLLLTERWCTAAGLHRALGLGLAGGMLVALRWQDALLPAALLPALVVAWRQDAGGRRRRTIELLAAAGAAALPVAVQLLAFDIQFGRAWLVPQGEGYLHWAEPALASFLASPFHGLLPWTPGLALGLAGVGLAARGTAGARRALVLGLVAALPVVVYLNAAVRDWWAGDSLGPRRLSTLVPVAALGTAAVFRVLSRRWVVLLAAALSVWAVVLTSAFFSGWDDLRLLFTGRLAADNPNGPERYAALRWRDGWGPLHYLKPGFTFTDTPGNRDRLVGLAAVALLLAGVGRAWRRLCADRRVQWTAVGAGLVWTLVWLALLVRAPANAASNAAWRDITRGREVDVAGLPQGVRAAAHLVLAAHATRSGRPDLAQRHLERAATREFPAVSPAALDAAAAEVTVWHREP